MEQKEKQDTWWEYVDDDATKRLQELAENYSKLAHFFNGAAEFHFPASQIFDFLYLGDAHNAANLKWLQETQITHVFNCAREVNNAQPDLFSTSGGTFKHLPLEDSSRFNALVYMNEAADFIQDVHLKDKNARILVHCAQGISRSATMVIAYLLKYHAKAYGNVESALAFVRKQRGIVAPNSGFLEQLDCFCAIVLQTI